MPFINCATIIFTWGAGFKQVQNEILPESNLIFSSKNHELGFDSFNLEGVCEICVVADISCNSEGNIHWGEEETLSDLEL